MLPAVVIQPPSAVAAPPDPTMGPAGPSPRPPANAFTTFHPFVSTGSDGTFQEMKTIATARLLAIAAILVFLWNFPEVAIVLLFVITARPMFMRARRIRSQLRKLQ